MIAGGFRWLFIFILLLGMTLPLLAQETLPPADPPRAPDPPLISQEGLRLLELGQRLMGKNNPNFALSSEKLNAEERNEAGSQALRIFRQVTTQFPEYHEGWLWLGIAFTETLRYSREHPKGKSIRTRDTITQGVRAFRKAYECKPDDLICATYYGDALMNFLGDFDEARRFWEAYLHTAKTDMQTVTALTQIARACLNKGYFGKIEKKLSPEAIAQQYREAEKYIAEAAEICPRAPNVKTMQELLQQYRKELLGK